MQFFSCFKIVRNLIKCILDYNITTPEQANKYNDYLSINFREGWIDKIDDFSKYVNRTFNKGREKEHIDVIEIDAGAAKEKKNFNYMAKVTFMISLFLLVFSILTISLFVSNLLKSHLSKIKRNLGTFKAFGLSDGELKNIYIIIMIRFVLISLFISFVITVLLSYILGLIFSNFSPPFFIYFPS